MGDLGLGRIDRAVAAGAQRADDRELLVAEQDARIGHPAEMGGEAADLPERRGAEGDIRADHPLLLAGQPALAAPIDEAQKPEQLAGQPVGRRALPKRRHLAADDRRPLAEGFEGRDDPAEPAGRGDRVVVEKGNVAGAGLFEREIARARQTRGRGDQIAEPLDIGMVAADGAGAGGVGRIVDDEDLAARRIEILIEQAADRRDQKVVSVAAADDRRDHGRRLPRGHLSRPPAA